MSLGLHCLLPLVLRAYLKLSKLMSLHMTSGSLWAVKLDSAHKAPPSGLPALDWNLEVEVLCLYCSIYFSQSWKSLTLGH